DSRVQPPARFDRALESLAVDPDQPEMRRVTASPFEVVRVGPVEVTADVGAVLDRGVHLAQGLFQILLALGVIGGGDSVLGDIDWLPVPARFRDAGMKRNL